MAPDGWRGRDRGSGVRGVGKRRRRWRGIAALLALAGALGACATSPPRISGQPPPGIAYRFHGSDDAQAKQQAEQYCGRWGRHAELQKVTTVQSDRIGTFACR